MFRKWSTSFCVYNILIATHLQPEYTTNTHEIRGEQSVRRRKPIHRARILTLPNIHFRFLVHVCPHYQIRIFILLHTYVRSSFCGFFIYAGTINRTPTAANGLHFVVVYVSANTIKLCTNVHLQLAITQQHTQNAYFCIAKTILLQCKNHLFARQKPYFCNAKTPFLVDAYIALIKH